MAYELTKKIRSVDTYIPGDSSDCKVRLDANESCYDLPESVREKVAEAIGKMDFNRYPDPFAKEVTAAFADYYGISPDICTAGNGSDELIGLILGSFLEKGDTVLTLSPDFSMYAFYGYMDELKVKSLQKEDDLKINVSKVIEYCNNNDVKAVIFSNPCNPTSLGVTRQDMLRLVKNVFCLVIVDEAYMDFWGETILGDIGDYDNLIVLKTCSKNLGLAGLRLGFAVSSPRITEALKAVKSPYNINSVTQKAAAVILCEKGALAESTAEIRNSCKELYKGIYALTDRYFTIEKVYDSVTNFVFFKTPKASEICKRLREKSVAVRQIGGYIRVTAGTPEENQVFLTELEDILSLI